MKAPFLPKIPRYPRLLMPMLFALFLFFDSFGQAPAKMDYIVVGDSALSQGFVQSIPSEENTVIYFTQTKRTKYERYTEAQVTEFRLSERMFYRKRIPQGVGGRMVFMEKLPNSIPDVVFWKLYEDSPKYYVETSEGLELLDESFRNRLGEVLDNPILEPLLAITRRNDVSLVYLSRAANKVTKPRTFARPFSLTPHIGFNSQTVQFGLPDANGRGSIGGASPSIGLDGEAFLTFRRNISLTLGVLWAQFDSQEFIQYQRGQARVDSDFYLDFRLLQIPTMLRYYVDLSPNKWRLYAAAGYSYAVPSYDKQGVYQAVVEGTTVVTSTRQLEMDSYFSGMTLGLGVERYFGSQRGMAFGLRQFKVNGEKDGVVKGMGFQLGYKF